MQKLGFFGRQSLLLVAALLLAGTASANLKPMTLWRSANKRCKTLWPRWLARAQALNTWPA